MRQTQDSYDLLRCMLYYMTTTVNDSVKEKENNNVGLNRVKEI